MRVAILSLFFLIAPAGNAQQVHKCMKGKEVSYQSAACDASQTLVKQWDATPEPELEPELEPPAVELGHDRVKHRQEDVKFTQFGRATSARRPGSGNRVGKKSPINTAATRCDAANARREAQLISVGLKRTFDLLRKLDDAVHEACKQ